LIAKNIAPGSFRKFAFQQFSRYDQSLFTHELEAAKKKIFLEKQHTIIASDIDPEMIRIAQENAKHAGVADYITFETKDVNNYLVTSNSLLGTLVTNPPYGLRMNNIVDLDKLYRTIAELFAKHPKLHGGIITSYTPFGDMQYTGNRKKSPFYNGGEECRFYKKSLL
jgi:putative N6-adenine-specific DNA methylase